MGQVKLHPESITALVAEMKQQNLVLVHSSVAYYGFEFMREREAMLKLKAVTPNMIIKYKLLTNVKSVRTIKNMVADGRIGKNEWFKDSKGVMQILTAAIKRISHGN